MPKGYFITGTSTDVGKTYVAAALLKERRKEGQHVAYYKPCMSSGPGKTDLDFVVQASGLRPLDAHVSYAFNQAYSPHLAAELIGESINLSQLEQDYRSLASQYEHLIVEGCGGIVCPLSNDLLQEEVMRSFQLDLLLVSDSGLGAINACVLSADYAKSRALTLAGIILNRYDENNPIHRNNRYTIEKLTGIPIIRTFCSADM